MTDNAPTPWEKWVAKNLATPQQKIRGWLIFWVFCLIVAPLMVMDGHDRLSTRIFIIGAISGWIPALIIFIKMRNERMAATEEKDT